MKGRTLDRLAALVFIALAVAMWVVTASYPDYAPDARRYARFIACCLGGLSVLLLFTAGGDGRVSWVAAPKRWIVTVVFTVLYALIIDYLGFYLATALYLPALGRVLGFRRPVLLALVTGITLLLVWVVFVKFLVVPVPTGTLWG